MYFEEKGRDIILVGEKFDLKVSSSNEIFYRGKKSERFTNSGRTFRSEVGDKREFMRQLYGRLELLYERRGSENAQLRDREKNEQKE